MWNILGEDALYVDLPYKFEKRIVELAKDDEKGKKFKDVMKKAEVEYILNGDTEESCFMIKVPDELKPEDIQMMADVILDALTSFGKPAILVDETEQKYKVVISNDEEPELLGIHKTPGMSSMEVFKPIIEGWDAPGKLNPKFDE